MELKVLFSEDPAFVLSKAGVFLCSQPVLHNLILSILHERAEHGDAGRYWMAMRQGEIVGVVIQSPSAFPAILTPMEASVATATCDAMAEADIGLPGISGDASTAATFAGQWGERRKLAAIPFQGNRVCEFLRTVDVPSEKAGSLGMAKNLLSIRRSEKLNGKRPDIQKTAERLPLSTLIDDAIAHCNLENDTYVAHDFELKMGHVCEEFGEWLPIPSAGNSGPSSWTNEPQSKRGSHRLTTAGRQR